MAMFPHERSLVQRMQGKPFALIGVNGDDDDVSEKVKDQMISWRSFKDNRGGDKPKISQEWNVQGWPTLYLIDHEGIIRHKWLGSPGDEVIDEEIDKLVALAEGNAAPEGEKTESSTEKKSEKDAEKKAEKKEDE